jgi:molecular chaperone GrpE
MSGELGGRICSASPPEAPGGAAAVSEKEADSPGREELAEQLLRLRAEFDNYRKRISREREEDRSRLISGLVADLLPVLDALEGAVGAEAESETVARYQQGVSQLLEQFLAILQGAGLEEVPGCGGTFDPELHEAVETVKAVDRDPGTILEVLQKGYLLGGRLLRAARVRVSARPTGSEEEDMKEER